MSDGVFVPDVALATRPVEWKFEKGYIARNIRTGETRDAREYLKEAWPNGPWEFDADGKVFIPDDKAWHASAGVCRAGHREDQTVCLACMGLARAPVGYAGEPLVPGTLAALGLQPEVGKKYVHLAGADFLVSAVEEGPVVNVPSGRVSGSVNGRERWCALNYFRENYKPTEPVRPAGLKSAHATWPCIGCGGKQSPGSYWCAPCKAKHEPAADDAVGDG